MKLCTFFIKNVSGIDESQSSIMLSFTKECVFFQSDCITYVPAVCRVTIHPHSCQHLLSSDFKSFESGGWKWDLVLFCISQITNKV